VQWPQLQQKYPRAYYAGRLMWRLVHIRCWDTMFSNSKFWTHWQFLYTSTNTIVVAFKERHYRHYYYTWGMEM
jgi:hypothetical protein